MKEEHKMKAEKAAIDRIFAYAKKAGKNGKNRGGEIGGFLLGTKYTDGDFLVEDAIILKQHRSSVGFAIEDDALTEFTKNASDKELSSIIGWWHSHNDMGTFYSTDDDKTFKRLAAFFGYNCCVGVVVNTKGEEHWRVMVVTKDNTFVDIDNVKIEVEEPITQTVVDVSDYDDKVIDDFAGTHSEHGVYELCSACKGTGYQKSSKIKRLINYLYDAPPKRNKKSGAQEDFDDGQYYYDDWGQKVRSNGSRYNDFEEY
jgi:proteasome lid subunit RPN8/RPN11